MSGKPKTYNGDLANLPPALLPLTAEDRWIVWRWELRATKAGIEKWTKPPYQARFPRQSAKSNDPSTWGSYVDAVAAVLAGHADGIGYMLRGSSIGAVGLDHARDAESGAVSSWAEAIRTEANGAYCEITVSGGGLRIISQATGPEIHRKFTFDRKTGAGIEIYRDTCRYITVSGLEIGACNELPEPNAFLDTLYARHSKNSSQRQNSGLNFNDAGRQPSFDYENIIKNGAPEGQRSEFFQAVVWHLASKGWSAEQIAEELAKHPNGIGQKYANRLPAEVTRSYDKWRSEKHTATTGGTTTNNWPQIRVISGELPRVVNEAEEALLTCGREIYQRGGMLVRPVLSKLKASEDRETWSWRLIPVSQPHLVETLTCAAQFLKWDARSKGFVPTDAPEKVAQTLLAREGRWKLPILSGVVNTPFIREDGSVCEQPGYDTASGLLLKSDGENFPPIPQYPTRADALEALEFLEKLIATFPFVAEADRSVALSAILTALDRRSIATAPLHAFTAPLAGTGKSLLVDVIAMIATGRLMPVIAQGRTGEELEKRLGAALLAGDAVISIDNCDHILEGSFLCQALTQQRLNIRLLGFSRNVETPINAAIFATGNNLTIAGDLNRRTLLCSLDAKEEHPEQREFSTDLIETIRASRGSIVIAALTVLRAWHGSNERVSNNQLLGSFEDWSRRIRASLLWIGRADPCTTMVKIKDNDPERAALYTVLAQWEEKLTIGQNYTVQEVINCALNSAEFHTALLNVAAGRGNFVSNRRFGRWLKAIEGKIVNGLMLAEAGIRSGYPTWCLRRV
jgi:hypothetical protein